MRDLLEASMAIIVRHDISESEFWGAVNYLRERPEMGLLPPAPGLSISWTVHRRQGCRGGSHGRHAAHHRGAALCRGRPLVDGSGEVNLTDDPDDTARC
jgi:catechol 1,2-dioxygenase